MNSIDIAQKLIDENDSIIESYRAQETEVRKYISDTEEKIQQLEESLEKQRASLDRYTDWLQEIQEGKKEYLVDNLALKLLIANGGGLDMLDD